MINNSPTVIAPGQKGKFQSPLYDTYTLAVNTATPAEITWFADVVNTNNKLIQDTNMQMASQIPQPEEMTVQAIRVVCIGMLNADIKALFKNYRFQFLVNSVVFAEGGAEFFPGGAGVAKYPAGTGAETEDVNLNGIADPRAINLLQPGYEIPLKAGMVFNVVAKGSTFNTTNTAGFGLKIRVYLDGVRWRPVTS